MRTFIYSVRFFTLDFHIITIHLTMNLNILWIYGNYTHSSSLYR